MKKLNFISPVCSNNYNYFKLNPKLQKEYQRYA